MQSSVQYLPDYGADWLELWLDRTVLLLRPLSPTSDYHLFMDLVEVWNLEAERGEEPHGTAIRFRLQRTGLYRRATCVLIGDGLYKEIDEAVHYAVGEINQIRPSKAQCDYIAGVLRSDVRSLLV